MTWTIKSALESGAIQKTEPTVDGYSFWLRGIPTEIRVTLSVNGVLTRQVRRPPAGLRPLELTEPTGPRAGGAA